MLMPVDINRLHSDGFVTVQEGAIGEQVQAMRQSRFPIRTAEGLDFCKRTVLDDTVRTLHFAAFLANSYIAYYFGARTML